MGEGLVGNKMLKAKLKTILYAFGNYLKSRFGNYKLFYLVDFGTWVIRDIGNEVCHYLNQKSLMRATLTCDFRFLKNKVIHVGAKYLLYNMKSMKNVHSSNKIVLTWYHVTDYDLQNTNFSALNNRVSIVHTSCSITKDVLVKNGIDENKIKIAPIGIDAKKFFHVNQSEKDLLRKKYYIPSDKFVIGSFQKDGNGWTAGNEPKLVKGPDIFCDVIEELSKTEDVFVLLTGPARGYVKNRLQELNVPFSHIPVRQKTDIVFLYQCLDLYVISSRVEGGPQSLLESMGCGIPFVASKVGQVVDIVDYLQSNCLVEVGDVSDYVVKIKKIFQNEELRTELIERGLSSYRNYDWKIIVRNMYWNIYKELIVD